MKETVSRKEYLAQYYRDHPEKYKENYNAQTQYIKWVEVKKTIFRLKRRIGADSYNLIIDELMKLEREKH